ncbi:MAG: IS3 family transposase [Planctomycetota bacterium]
MRRQCAIAGLNRSSWYYEPALPSTEDRRLMDLLDEQYTKTPFYGVRNMTTYLRSLGYTVGKDHTRTLLRKMGLVAIFPKPNLSKPHPENRVYPYLLRDLDVVRPNQAWCADITYIRLNWGFAYLVAIVDWYSRYVLAWRLSNTLEADFCVEALRDAIEHYGIPDVFNTDQGTQFTPHDFINVLTSHNISISMDGRGRCLDNIFVERLWRTVKYENVYLKGYQTIPEARAGLTEYFGFYNKERFHQSLDNKTPWEVYSSLPGVATEQAQIGVCQDMSSAEKTSYNANVSDFSGVDR